MQQKFQVENDFGEMLDVLVEGVVQARVTVVFVHGFGTDKHERGLFDAVAAALAQDYRIVRFDFSGYGKSEGKDVDADYLKLASDLDAVLLWVTHTYKGRLFLVAHSAGCLVTLLLGPKNIEKVVFTGIPNSNGNFIADRMLQRFGGDKSHAVNQFGVSMIERSTGQKQQIGPSFWKVLRDMDISLNLKDLITVSKVKIVHPVHDEVIGEDFLDLYASYGDDVYVELDGDHNFSNPGDRDRLIALILTHFSE